jgi:hypothetical protein
MVEKMEDFGGKLTQILVRNQDGQRGIFRHGWWVTEQQQQLNHVGFTILTYYDSSSSSCITLVSLY